MKDMNSSHKELKIYHNSNHNIFYSDNKNRVYRDIMNFSENVFEV